MEFSKRMDRFGESIFTVMKNRRTAVESRGQEVIDFSIGAPNIPPAPHITKVLSEEALKPENYLTPLWICRSCWMQWLSGISGAMG